MNKTTLVVVIALTSASCHRPDVPERERTAPPAEPLVFDVHEWGLMDVFPDFAAGTSGSDLLAGPSRISPRREAQVTPRPPRPVRQRPAVSDDLMNNVPRKPVLYFHHHSGPQSDLTARIRIENGRLVELWPQTIPHQADAFPPETTFRVAFDGPRTCHVDPNDRLQTLCDSAPAPDGYCERLELATYETSDATCMAYQRDDRGLAASRVPFLFYRAERQNERLSTLPIEFRHEERREGQVQLQELVRADFSESDVSRYFRIQYRSGNARIVSGLLNTPLADPERDPLITSPDAISLCLADLRAQGLTEPEANAFVRAWRNELFDGAAPDGDVFLFWLPASHHHLVSELTFSPRPRAIRRALMVRLPLGSLPTNASPSK